MAPVLGRVAIATLSKENISLWWQLTDRGLVHHYHGGEHGGMRQTWCWLHLHQKATGSGL